MRLVSIKMLKQDMVLAKSIYYNDLMLLRKGQSDIVRFGEKLRNLGIEYVYIEDSKSDGIEIPDVLSEDTRITCRRILRKIVNDYSSGNSLDISILSDAITRIIDDILENPDVQISLNDISASDEYTFSHSISTTVYSLIIARSLNYNRLMLELLATGTLLHDLGKVFIDKKILLKQDSLTEEEFEYIKKHTIYGYESLKKYSSLSELSRIISLYHHERMDASGYPTGVPAGTLHEFVRIVGIADVYDALTSDRCYRKKWSANRATNHLIENATTKFDFNLVNKFIKQIAIYPNGSMVRLSNSTIGIVKEQNQNMPLRPIVRVISDENDREISMHEVDLMKNLSITILDSEIEIG
jgi:putative nucleotidyltransferase with HDIG domain